MHIVYKQGDMFKSSAAVLVNPINSQGISGKGLAKIFKTKFPKNHEHYDAVIRASAIRPPGDLYPFRTGALFPSWIINIITKDYYWNPSTYFGVSAGLMKIVEWCNATEVESIAIPALGCGEGGLKWETVKGLMDNLLVEFKTAKPTVYIPLGY